jgi:hypothetical protein
LTSRQIVAGSTDSLARDSGLSSAELTIRTSKPSRSLERSAPDLDEELAREVSESQLAADPLNQKWVASQPGVKIAVRKDGFYRVTRDQLQTAGFDVNGDSAKWQLFADGNEQSIIVGPSDAYIEFFGKGQDTPETDIRTYYLVNGTSGGKRIESRIIGRIGLGLANISYPQTLTKKQRTNFLRTDVPLNADGGNYYGNAITTFGSSLTFNLSSIDTASSSASITINATGYSLDPVAPHSIDVSVNGHFVGTLSGEGLEPMSQQFSIPTDFLVEGSNQLQMASTASISDVSYFDLVQVGFKRKYIADQNRLSAVTQNYHQARLTGFDSPAIRVFDTTFDGSPVLIDGLFVQQDNGTFSVLVPPYRGMVISAVGDSGLLSPVSISANTPSTLSTVNHQADLVIISYSDPAFISAANAWANYRRNQGVAVEVVDIADVYDEFSFGAPTPASINQFLQYAHGSWQVKPSYVLLLGDGSYDPRNYEGYGSWNLIPTPLVQTNYGRYPSDEVLGDFDGDGLSEMRIGRIPARTGTEIMNAFAKVQGFEIPQQPFTRGVLFAYDQSIAYDFLAISNTLADKLPAGTSKSFVQADGTSGASKAAFVSEFNTGKYIVNYAGHGATGTLGNSNFFTISDVPQLTNSNQSIVTMLSCLNGFFVRPQFDSISESILKRDSGGAVATWSSSGESTPFNQTGMGSRFFEKLSAGTITRMGDLVFDAKSTLDPHTDVGYTWVLLGDPMLRVQ